MSWRTTSQPGLGRTLPPPNAPVMPASPPIITPASLAPVFNVRGYGARGDGATDDTAAIQAAINAASGPNPGRVVVPPGTYLISKPLVLQNPDSSLAAPGPVPLLTGMVAPGRIGDADDTSSSTILCGPTFPAGEYAIQFLGPNSNQAPSGGGIKNLEANCNNLAAGVLVHQPRRAVFEHLSVHHTGAPLGSADQPFGVAPSAGFAVVQSSGSAGAYNHFSDINVAYAALDSFEYATLSKDNFFSCYSLDPGRYAYNVGTTSAWHGCHYSGGQTAWAISQENSVISVFGSLILVGTVTAPAVLVYAASATDSNGLAAFYGCLLIANPPANQGANGAVVHVTPGGNNNIANLLFDGCSFKARGNQANPTITAFGWIDSGVSGTVEFNDCTVNGAPVTAPFIDDTDAGVLAVRNTQGYNPVGPNVTQPAIPASGTAVTNTTGVDCTVFVEGGTVSEIAIGGHATGATSGPFRVPVGQTITLTYTAAPTWTWFGD